MKSFASNNELYEYMQWLASILQSRGAPELAARVISASHTAIGLSTEFLGESKLALEKVIESEASPLSEAEQKDVMSAISQVDVALNSRPNAD